MKSPSAQTVISRLAENADVLIENLALGTMQRLGCGYEELARLNPGLIYCALKGFLSGPYERRPALDDVLQYMAGLEYMTGPPGKPLRAGASVVDILGGAFGVIGVLAAIEERHRSSRGQLVKSALFESATFLASQHMVSEVAAGAPVPPMLARRGARAIYETLPTADGKMLFVGITSNAHWGRQCSTFGMTELLEDSALQTNEQRVRERPRIVPLVAGLVGKLTLDGASRRLRELDIPCSPVATPSGLFDDPHLNHGGCMHQIHVGSGRYAKIPGIPVEMGRHVPDLRL